MALKGSLWLLGRALEEERNRSILCHLSARALDLGLRKTDSTRGHVFQAAGAVQNFLEAHPEHVATIDAASPVEPYKLAGDVLDDWKAFLAGCAGTYGRGQGRRRRWILQRPPGPSSSSSTLHSPAG